MRSSHPGKIQQLRDSIPTGAAVWEPMQTQLGEPGTRNSSQIFLTLETGVKLASTTLSVALNGIEVSKKILGWETEIWEQIRILGTAVVDLVRRALKTICA